MSAGVHETKTEILASGRPQEKWVRDIHGRLRQMKNLERGWDSYEAEPPNSRALEHAEAVIEKLQRANLRPGNVAPSVIGGVGFSFVAADKYAAIEIDNDDHVLVVTTAGEEKVAHWDFPFSHEEISSAIKKITAFLKR